MRQDLLLERHGDSDTVERQVADNGEQVVESTDLERQHDGVDVFAAECGGVHERREGVGDGIAGDREDARGLVKLVEAINIEERARGDLASSSLGAVG